MRPAFRTRSRGGKNEAATTGCLHLAAGRLEAVASARHEADARSTSAVRAAHRPPDSGRGARHDDDGRSRATAHVRHSNENGKIGTTATATLRECAYLHRVPRATRTSRQRVVWFATFVATESSAFVGLSNRHPREADGGRGVEGIRVARSPQREVGPPNARNGNSWPRTTEPQTVVAREPPPHPVPRLPTP